MRGSQWWLERRSISIAGCESGRIVVAPSLLSATISSFGAYVKSGRLQSSPSLFYLQVLEESPDFQMKMNLRGSWVSIYRHAVCN